MRSKVKNRAPTIVTHIQSVSAFRSNDTPSRKCGEENSGMSLRLAPSTDKVERHHCDSILLLRLTPPQPDSRLQQQLRQRVETIP